MTKLDDSVMPLGQPGGEDPLKKLGGSNRSLLQRADSKKSASAMFHGAQ